MKRRLDGGNGKHKEHFLSDSGEFDVELRLPRQPVAPSTLISRSPSLETSDVAMAPRDSATSSLARVMM